MKILLRICAWVSIGLSSASAYAASSRQVHRFGIHAGLFDPFPTLVGFNLDVNLLSFLRITGGYGSISETTLTTLTATTLGGGARFMIPNWNFSPVAGISYANVTLTGTGTSVSGFSASGNHAYVTTGIDWQAQNGFNLGLGVNTSLNTSIGSLPYFNIGWFF